MFKQANIRIAIIGLTFVFMNTFINVGLSDTDTASMEILPEIQIIAPDGGEFWDGNTVNDIEYLCTGGISSVDLMFSADGMVSWETIERAVTTIPGLNSYPWLTPDISSTLCAIEISAIAHEETKLVHGNCDSYHYDMFGRHTAIYGDTVVIAAHRDNDVGAVYVFIKKGMGWIQYQKLTASDAAISDQFGSSVAIYGDTIVIGAEEDDDGGTYSGSAYVFVKDSGIWTEQAKLIASDPAEFDHFGESVSIYEDTIIVGSSFDDDVFEDSGSAYVFVRNVDTWSQQAKLTASDPHTLDFFGQDVSIWNNIAVIGSRDNAWVGAAYVFERNGESWNQQAKLKASDGVTMDFFGARVSIYDDLIAVGSPHNDGSCENSGSAYIFANNGNSWV